MKWFKHISDSLTDPFVMGLMEKFGATGYVVFFGTLEIYAREFKITDGWHLAISVRSYCRLLGLRRSDLVLSSLQHIADSGKWEVIRDDGRLNIYIPKFTQLLDEATKKKLREAAAKLSGINPPKVATDADEDADEDADSKEEGRPPDGGLPRGGQDDQPTPLEAGNEIQVMGRTHFSIPLKDGTEFNVSPQDVDQWAEAYPNLGRERVERALRRMAQWAMSKPSKRKTRKGVRAFINTWLKGDEDEVMGKKGPDDDQYRGLG